MVRRNRKSKDQILQSAHSGVERMDVEINNLIGPIKGDVDFFAERIDATL